MFPSEVIKRIAELEEIDVETTGRKSGEPRRATVWVMVESGVPYVRSEYAERGKWYQNALADPKVAIWVDGERMEATASKVTDPAVLKRVSEALRRKYSHHGGYESMLAPEVEAATMELAAR